MTLQNRRWCEARRAGRQTSAQSGTRISCHAALDEATYAAFFEESRMRFTETTKPDRKSGGSRGTCGAPRLPHKGLRSEPVFPQNRPRDNKSVGPLTAIFLTASGAFPYRRIVIPPVPRLRSWNRSVAQWRDLLFLLRFSQALPGSGFSTGRTLLLQGWS